MWAESSRPENASSGEAMASQITPRPPAKANDRHAGNRLGEVRRKISQPRRYRMSDARTPKAIFGSKDHELRIACDVGDIGSLFCRVRSDLSWGHGACQRCVHCGSLAGRVERFEE